MLNGVDGFNHCRQLGAIGNIPPAEADYAAQVPESAMSARLNPSSLRERRGGFSRSRHAWHQQRHAVPVAAAAPGEEP
ncbi:hypothetical protein Y886_21510 [Xanthomonas hyacinthi DSM 19077]|nr:hypothetical protein Y886_21510 [Xanthomonas hyacinthi DSM 19077]